MKTAPWCILVLFLSMACRNDPMADGRTDVSFAVSSEQAAQSDSFVSTISVQTHLTYPSYQNWTGIVRPRLLELGVHHVREKMPTDATAVSRLQDLAANGVRLTGGCWPVGTNYANASHCIAAANGLGTGVVDAFDGWNEVEGKVATDWPSAWVAWETTLWQTYKGNSTWQSRPLYANSLAQAASALQLGNRSSILDAGNLHSYPGGGGLPSDISKTWIPNWKTVADPKPLIVTETGYHTCPACTNGVGVSVAAQGKLEPRILVEYFVHGIQRTSLYELIDEGTSTTDREDHWGLLFPDGTPKPAFTAIKNLISLLADPGASFAPGSLSYTLTGALTSTHHLLLRKRNGRSYLVFWQEVKTYDPTTEKDVNPAADAVTLKLGTAATSVKVYQPRTGTMPIQTGSGTTIGLSVPNELIVVEIVP